MSERSRRQDGDSERLADLYSQLTSRALQALRIEWAAKFHEAHNDVDRAFYEARIAAVDRAIARRGNGPLA